MLFDNVTGAYTTYDSTSITVDTLTLFIDYYKNWRVKIDTTEYEINSNNVTKLFFTNAIAAPGNFEISFVTRELLGKFESDMLDTTRVPEDLIFKKFISTQRHFITKIKGHFKNLYFNFETTDPLELIGNLREVQIAFCYYMIAEIYGDLKISFEDNAQMKEEDFRTKYREIIKESLALLAIDYNEDGELKNNEKATNLSNQGFLLR